MTRILSLTALACTVLGVAALTATPAAAGCDPACKKGETCRYDSTKDPEYWCQATGFQAGSKTVIRPGGGTGGSVPAQSRITLDK